MCTLIALHRCVASAPLVVAANRDEYLDRPAEGPALRQGLAGRIAAPLDRRAGGTWFGVNEHGLFAAITNRPCADPDPSRRSRGQLVLDMLGARKAWDAADQLAKLPEAAYNPFNLFVADAENAFACVYEEAPRCESLEPGVHVIGNADPNDRSVPKLDRLLGKAEQVVAAQGDGLLDDLAEICRGHDGDGPALQDTCIHAGGYGTRSSTLLRLGEPGTRSEWRFAEGAPCQNDYDDYSHLLRELGLILGRDGESKAR